MEINSWRKGRLFDSHFSRVIFSCNYFAIFLLVGRRERKMKISLEL
jgi:hypothetical protein